MTGNADVTWPNPPRAAPVDLTPLGLPHVFSPAEAATVLRSLGLTEMTECALRTRAYRKRVPFHLNGRRITFTLGDLREIAEGQARRPQSQAPPPLETPAKPTPRSRQRRTSAASAAGWRARRPRDRQSVGENGACQ